MKRAIVLLLLAACGGGRGTSTAPTVADEAMARGDLAAAEAALRGASDPESRWRRARLLLMLNRAGESAELLSTLVVGKVGTVDDAFLLQRIWMDLAAARARLDDFLGAAEAWKRLGDPVLTRKCELLARGPAYRIAPGWTDSILELRAVEPVPLVAARVNGREGLFVVDTGAGEIVLDRAFAKRAGVTTVGMQGGGAAEEAVADEVSLGRLSVRTVPVQISDMTSRAALKPDGAIGLAFLLHFDVTIDFRRSRLFLRKPGEASAGLPACIAGDRYLLVPGRMNGTIDTLVGIHTGLAGITAAPSEYFLQSRGETAREVSAGPLVLTKPPLSPAAYPLGLDESFGSPIGVVLGPAAFRGRTLRLDPRSMHVEIQ